MADLLVSLGLGLRKQRGAGETDQHKDEAEFEKRCSRGPLKSRGQ